MLCAVASSLCRRQIAELLRCLLCTAWCDVVVLRTAAEDSRVNGGGQHPGLDRHRRLLFTCASTLTLALLVTAAWLHRQQQQHSWIYYTRRVAIISAESVPQRRDEFTLHDFDHRHSRQSRRHDVRFSAIQMIGSIRSRFRTRPLALNSICNSRVHKPLQMLGAALYRYGTFYCHGAECKVGLHSQNTSLRYSVNYIG